MDVEKLTMELRPRPHWQAIDLGFALLRSRAGSVFTAWWVVWSVIVLLSCAGAFWKPNWLTLWATIPWFVRPAVERIVVHVLSRGVFGESVGWKEAVRAWPSTFGWELLHVLTWWRCWALGRSFLQPIWQLEGVTGSVASRRREALSRKGAGRTAGVWGLACAHLEMVLWIAVLALVGMFTNAAGDLNPFRFLVDGAEGTADSVHAATTVLTYGLVAGFVGPFYAACGFTLYLNRRAELEAWDIELALRKLARRKSSESTRGGLLPSGRILMVLLAALTLASHANTDTCSPPKWVYDPATVRRPSTAQERVEIRRQVDSIFGAEPRLKTWHCEETWVRKDTSKPAQKEPSAFWKEFFTALRLIGEFLGAHAIWIQWMFIGAAIALIVWIAWKYRDMVDFGTPTSRPDLDPAAVPRRRHIRAEEELESDPTDSVERAWAQGSRREALSLLYKLACRESATSGAVLRKGDTEGSVSRSLRRLLREQVIDEQTHSLFHDSVAMWSRAAWGGDWPTTDSVVALCARWRVRLSKADSA